MPLPRYALLLLAATGCHKADPAPSDPLLGRWEATKIRLYRYDRAGNFVADSVVTVSFALKVERDSIKQFTNGNYVQVYAYQRTGDAIYIPQLAQSGPLFNTWYVRSFTPTSFTMERNTPYKSFTRQTTDYHR